MESRIKHSHLRNARKRLLNRLNTLEVSWVMKRSELDALSVNLDDGTENPYTLRYFAASIPPVIRRLNE